jgi:hypothetical protein
MTGKNGVEALSRHRFPGMANQGGGGAKPRAHNHDTMQWCRDTKKTRREHGKGRPVSHYGQRLRASYNAMALQRWHPGLAGPAVRRLPAFAL